MVATAGPDCPDIGILNLATETADDVLLAAS
jgi:hypothetical protein